MKHIPNQQPSPSPRNGLSLIEVVVSSMLVGLILVGALRCVGAVVRGRTITADEARARALAQQLMTEILNDDYVDGGLLPLFGPELGEPLVSFGPRSGFNDVDDYHLWSASPPENRSGTALPNLTGWQREVSVKWVSASNPANISVSDSGVKRITVKVRRNGTLLATLVALRSKEYTIP